MNNKSVGFFRRFCSGIIDFVVVTVSCCLIAWLFSEITDARAEHQIKELTSISKSDIKQRYKEELGLDCSFTGCFIDTTKEKPSPESKGKTPTYLLTSPEGKQYKAKGDGTGEEALAHLQKQLRSENEVTQPTPPHPAWMDAPIVGQSAPEKMVTRAEVMAELERRKGAPIVSGGQQGSNQPAWMDDPIVTEQGSKFVFKPVEIRGLSGSRGFDGFNDIITVTFPANMSETEMSMKMAEYRTKHSAISSMTPLELFRKVYPEFDAIDKYKLIELLHKKESLERQIEEYKFRDEMKIWESEEPSNYLPTVIIIAFVMGYFVFSNSSKLQSTLGKYALGLKFVTKDGKKLNPKESLIHTALFFLLNMVSLGAVFFVFCLNPKKETLYDKIAGVQLVAE